MIEVVAGVIYKGNKFLIAQRNFKKAQGGLWEFPGGKIEQGETPQEALKREIKEEFNANITVGKYVGEVLHHYPEKDIHLSFYKAELIGDEFELVEHEDYAFIQKEEAENYQFAGADVKVLEMI